MNNCTDRSARALWLALAVAIAPLAHAGERESLIDPQQYRGLAADHRAYRVGDVITIYVLEATRAKSQAATEAGSKLDLHAGLSTPSTDYNGTLGIGGGNSAGAQTTRIGELRTQFSAQVVDVEANGNLRISGEQSLLVNGERQKIRLTGLVRPEDIDAGNSVYSTRIANADIELLGKGVVSESQRQSVLYRIFKWLRVL